MKPIVIVGGGPVGLVLSLVMARYEVPTLLLESRLQPTPRDESRAITWMPRGLELLDWLGLGALFAQLGVLRTAHEFWSGRQRLLTLPFDQVDSTHPYTLQLPQHDTEALLERAALATGCVEIRRGHSVVSVGQRDDAATMLVEGPEGSYEVSAPWAVGCDGARSTVRHSLGIESIHRDYGSYSVVADFEMDCDLPTDVSRLVLDHQRPYGFFYFSPRRWRLVYRLNPGEDRNAMITEEAATAILVERLPSARVNRFLWASAFPLRQGQSATYRKGRWLLSGDAAHAMGPSAGAGMMVGVLGAWRLGWRLALAAKEHPDAEGLLDRLLDDYDREQHAAADDIQDANATIFRNVAMRNPVAAGLRTQALRLLGRTSLPRKLVAREALTSQVLPASRANDRLKGETLKEIQVVGRWEVGRRAPSEALRYTGLHHMLLPVGGIRGVEQCAEASIKRAAEDAPFRVSLISASTTKVQYAFESGVSAPTYALVRPDQHVVAIYQI